MLMGIVLLLLTNLLIYPYENVIKRIWKIERPVVNVSYEHKMRVCNNDIGTLLCKIHITYTDHFLLVAVQISMIL